MANSAEQAERDPQRVWVLAGLWGTALLFGAHLALLFGQDYILAGLDLDTVVWNLRHAVGPTLVASLLVAFVSASLLVVARHASRLLRMAVILLVFALFACCIAGLGYEVEARIPDTSSGNGAKGWIVIDAVAVVLGLGMVMLVRRRRELRVTALALLVPLVLTLLSFGAFHWIDPPPIQIRQVVRSLLAIPVAWEATEVGAGGPARIGTVTPRNNWRGVGGDRSALIIPTGGTVTFEVEESDGFVSLQTAVAINQGNALRRESRWKKIRFGFQILVDGVVAAEETLHWGVSTASEEFGWRDIGGRSGVPLRPGNVVSLRTTVESEPPDPSIEEQNWRVGFSDPVLVELSERPREKSSPASPNIVLVVMDTLRKDRVGCYGYEKDTTPNLDRLAARGLVYEHASSTSSWTWPSTASIFTGMTPERHGVLGETSCHLSRDFDVLAEALQREGYSTAAYSGNALISPSKHFDQGFEHFFGGGISFYKSRLFVPDAIEWMRSVAGQRFFLYLHLVDPHHPHKPRAEAREKFITMEAPDDYGPKTYSEQTNAFRRGKARVPGKGVFDTTRVVSLSEQARISELYDACVATGDYWFGEVLNAIEDLDLEDETIIAFTADHGEEFFDHDMMEHGHSLFGELVDVPLVLAGPGIPSGERSAAIVSNLNIAPTLARLGGSEMRGLEELLDLSRPSELEEEVLGYSTEHGWWNNWHRVPIQGLREGRWILLFAPGAGAWRGKRPTPGGEFRLYDVEADPKQLQDLAAEHPERVAAMLARLKLRTQTQEELRTSIPIGAGDETLEMLQGIGYIDGEGD